MRITGLLLISACIFIMSFIISKTDQKLIIFYGDSITAGYGLSKEQAFPSIINKKILKKNHQYKVVNAGLSGETTAGGLNRLSWILTNQVDIFVLELGANDGLRGMPTIQTKNNLQSIITKVKASNPEVVIILAGMKVPPNMGKQYAQEFENIFPELAKENDIYLIPFLLKNVAGIGDLNLPDGIHPNQKGHELLANNVWEILKDLL